MIKRALSLTVALALIASALSACVFAGAYALFAFARPWTGPAGAAGVVAVVCAVFALVVIAGLGGFAPRKPAAPPEPASLTDRLFEMARERPIAATGVAVAAGLVLAIRNPAVIGVIVRGLFDKPGGRRRR